MKNNASDWRRKKLTFTLLLTMETTRSNLSRREATENLSSEQLTSVCSYNPLKLRKIIFNDDQIGRARIDMMSPSFNPHRFVIFQRLLLSVGTHSKQERSNDWWPAIWHSKQARWLETQLAHCTPTLSSFQTYDKPRGLVAELCLALEPDYAGIDGAFMGRRAPIHQDNADAQLGLDSPAIPYKLVSTVRMVWRMGICALQKTSPTAQIQIQRHISEW